MVGSFIWHIITVQVQHIHEEFTVIYWVCCVEDLLGSFMYLRCCMVFFIWINCTLCMAYHFDGAQKCCCMNNLTEFAVWYFLFDETVQYVYLTILMWVKSKDGFTIQLNLLYGIFYLIKLYNMYILPFWCESKLRMDSQFNWICCMVFFIW